jgi:hypothetical protein
MYPSSAENVSSRTVQKAQIPLFFPTKQAGRLKVIEGTKGMAYRQQSERGDIQKLVTESERHVRVLAAVAKTLSPRHTVAMFRDSNGILGLQIGNRFQRQYVLTGANPEEDFSVSAPVLPDEPEEHLRIHFASEIAKNKAPE